jgi:hypothetical protein
MPEAVRVEASGPGSVALAATTLARLSVSRGRSRTRQGLAAPMLGLDRGRPATRGRWRDVATQIKVIETRNAGNMSRARSAVSDRL